MSTIAETLNEIPTVTSEIAELANKPKVLDKQFLTNISNWLAVYEHTLLAHACLEELTSAVVASRSSSQFFRRYTLPRESPPLYQEFIRVSNIEGLSFLWFEVEQLLSALSEQRDLPRKPREGLQWTYQRLLEDIGFDEARTAATLKTFEGIRRTRNSLHNGGRDKPAQGKERALDFELVDGTRHSVRPNENVTPLRLLSVVKTLLAQYREIEDAIAGTSQAG